MSVLRSVAERAMLAITSRFPIAVESGKSARHSAHQSGAGAASGTELELLVAGRPQSASIPRSQGVAFSCMSAPNVAFGPSSQSAHSASHRVPAAGLVSGACALRCSRSPSESSSKLCSSALSSSARSTESQALNRSLDAAKDDAEAEADAAVDAADGEPSES